VIWYIDDYGLSPEALEKKYEKLGYHPGYWKDQWELCSHTNPDYWVWVRGKLWDEQDELDEDNPYNGGLV